MPRSPTALVLSFTALCLGSACITPPLHSGDTNPQGGATPSPAPSLSPSPSATPVVSGGWNLTVYYTAVESFHTGSPIVVSGCLDQPCTAKGTIGSYPSDFVAAVREEGAGRITSGARTGGYLNWASNIGYWLDTAPRDAQGGALTPFVSSAADASVFGYGVRFKVVDCGTDGGGGQIDPKVCSQIEQASWQVTDRFEPGRGGSQHLDLYIGEEDQANFVNSSPKVISTQNAKIETP